MFASKRIPGADLHVRRMFSENIFAEQLAADCASNLILCRFCATKRVGNPSAVGCAQSRIGITDLPPSPAVMLQRPVVAELRQQELRLDDFLEHRPETCRCFR